MTAARTPGRDRGETSIETVLLVPVLLLILFVGVHVTSLARAGQVAHVAATRAAETAAAMGPTGMGPELTRSAAFAVIDDLGGSVDGPIVVSHTRGHSTVSVRLRIQGVVPGLPVVVTRSVTVASEMFIDADRRR